MRKCDLPQAFRIIVSLALLVAITGCSSFGAAGPSTRAIKAAPQRDSRIQIIELNDEVARRVVAATHSFSLAQTLGEAPLVGTVVGPGDVIDLTIWEAPPAALFNTTPSAGASLPQTQSAPSVARSTDIPSQMVDMDGKINVPFVGSVQAVGRRPQEIAKEVVSRLARIAHDPQVIVRILDNQAANVTIVGDVANSRRMPLTSKGERLLDALASAGGVRQPVEKITIQVTRGEKVASEPLAAVIRNPTENIRLQANDVVTVIFQPFSFQALGATGINAEINFEGTGITLAQALGRIGGLQDNRADIKGVFIFRLEDPAALPADVAASVPRTPDDKIPVIYRVDLSNPASFFVTQGFPIHNKDILYVSNAPMVDLQKFVSVVTQMTYSLVNIGNAVN